MDFDLSPEQSLLKDSVGRLMADHYAFEKRKSYAASADGWSREMWGRYAELVSYDDEDGEFFLEDDSAVVAPQDRQRKP